MQQTSHFENAYVGKEEREIRKKLNERVFINTSYGFLQSHRGFRPGFLHGLLGETSGGKTTMIRSLIMDFLHFSGEEDEVLLWLSEESKENYKNNISYSGFSDERMHSKHKKVHLFSEVDAEGMSDEEKMSLIQNNLNLGNYKLMIFDNITTSPMFSGNLNKYEKYVDWLKALANKTQVPILVVMHTGKNVPRNRLYTPDDVRGSSRISNVCEYFYIMQGFTVESKRHTILRVAKHRNHNVIDSLYEMMYSPKHRVFFKDEKRNFKAFKELFKKRNQL